MMENDSRSSQGISGLLQDVKHEVKGYHDLISPVFNEWRVYAMGTKEQTKKNTAIYSGTTFLAQLAAGGVFLLHHPDPSAQAVMQDGLVSFLLFGDAVVRFEQLWQDEHKGIKNGWVYQQPGIIGTLRDMYTSLFKK